MKRTAFILAITATASFLITVAQTPQKKKVDVQITEAPALPPTPPAVAIPSTPPTAPKVVAPQLPTPPLAPVAPKMPAKPVKAVLPAPPAPPIVPDSKSETDI